MTATSSALAERTWPSVAPAAAPAAAGASWPKAPNSTFATERFIARPISIVRSVPEAPTSMPLTIRTLFSSSNPVAAAARPVKAFRSEITTGMSAPPFGACRDGDSRREHTGEEERVCRLLQRIDDRPAANQLLQLRERDHRACERDAPDDRREHDRGADVRLQCPGIWRAVVELR